VGQLEDEELFYLASRGLDPERARGLLTYGFAEDVISRISLKVSAGAA
jgi:Fe-S cluster assembly protein SufD